MDERTIARATPKAIIFRELGGFTAQSQGKKVSEKADAIIGKIAKYMLDNGLDIYREGDDLRFVPIHPERKL